MTPMLRDFRHPALWLLLWVMLIALVIIACLVPPPPIPSSIRLPWWFDKAEHLLSYTVLAAYAAMLFAPRRPLIFAALGLIGVGLMVEGMQALTSWRSGDLADALANAIGVAAGMLCAATPAARWLQRFDQLLGGRRA